MGDRWFKVGLLIGGLALAVVGLSLVLILTSGGNDKKTATETVTKTAAARLAPSKTIATTTAASGQVAEFRSPTGNIVCHVDVSAASCGMRVFNYTPTPQPADCDLPGWGHNFTVGTSGVGAFACRDEAPAATDSPILPYDHVLTLGPFKCDSSSVGILCENSDTGHGYAISRGRFRVY